MVTDIEEGDVIICGDLIGTILAIVGPWLWVGLHSHPTPVTWHITELEEALA